MEPRHPQLSGRTDRVGIAQEEGEPGRLHLVALAHQGGRQPVPEALEAGPRPLLLIGREEPGEVAAQRRRLLDLGLVEGHVVAHVERVAADRDRLPDLDRQLVFEHADRHPLDRDRRPVVLGQTQLGLDVLGVELLLGIERQVGVELGQINRCCALLYEARTFALKSVNASATFSPCGDGELGHLQHVAARAVVAVEHLGSLWPARS